MTDTLENERKESLSGLAFCHTESGRDLIAIFPELSNKFIKWKYIDIIAEESPNQIEGSIYEPSVLEEALSRNKGYDYVVMPFCPIGINDQLKLYNLVAPLIAASCLLKEGGTVISTNFILIATQHVDTEGLKMKMQADEDAKNMNISAVEKYVGRKIYLTGNLERDNMGLGIAIRDVYNERIKKLSKDPLIIAKVDKLCSDIGYLAGYESFEKYMGPKNNSYISFVKGSVER